MTHTDNVLWGHLKYTVMSVSRINSLSDNKDESWYQCIVGHCNTSLNCKSHSTLQGLTERADKLPFDLDSRCDLHSGAYGGYCITVNMIYNKQEKG